MGTVVYRDRGFESYFTFDIPTVEGTGATGEEVAFGLGPSGIANVVLHISTTNTTYSGGTPSMYLNGQLYNAFGVLVKDMTDPAGKVRWAKESDAWLMGYDWEFYTAAAGECGIVTFCQSHGLDCAVVGAEMLLNVRADGGTGQWDSGTLHIKSFVTPYMGGAFQKLNN